MFLNKKSLNVYEIVDYEIITNSNLGEGRPILAVLLYPKKHNNKEIQELVDIHKSIEAGDVTAQWGRLKRMCFFTKTIYLLVKTTKPMILEFQIELDTEEHFFLIETILQSKGLLIGFGNQVDKFSTKIKEGDLVVLEIQNTGFENTWEKILRKSVRKKLKGEVPKVPRRKLKETVSEEITKMRDFLSIRR